MGFLEVCPLLPFSVGIVDLGEEWVRRLLVVENTGERPSVELVLLFLSCFLSVGCLTPRSLHRLYNLLPHRLGVLEGGRRPRGLRRMGWCLRCVVVGVDICRMGMGGCQGPRVGRVGGPMLDRISLP